MIGLARQAAGAVVIVLTTWVVRAFLTATPSAPLPACVCGCPAEAHEHYRRGVDCGACGPQVCAEYERPSVEHAAAVAYAEDALAFECGCGCGLLADTAERVDDAVSLDALRGITVSLRDLGYDSIEEYRTARAEMARRDAALGRPPLH